MELQGSGDEVDIASDLFDIHICGACKSQFHDVSEFLQHKRLCPTLAKLVAAVYRQPRQQHQQYVQQQGSSETAYSCKQEISTSAHIDALCSPKSITHHQDFVFSTGSQQADLPAICSENQVIDQQPVFSKTLKQSKSSSLQIFSPILHRYDSTTQKRDDANSVKHKTQHSSHALGIVSATPVSSSSTHVSSSGELTLVTVSEHEQCSLRPQNSSSLSATTPIIHAGQDDICIPVHSEQMNSISQQSSSTALSQYQDSHQLPLSENEITLLAHLDRQPMEAGHILNNTSVSEHLLAKTNRSEILRKEVRSKTDRSSRVYQFDQIARPQNLEQFVYEDVQAPSLSLLADSGPDQPAQREMLLHSDELTLMEAQNNNNMANLTDADTSALVENNGMDSEMAITGPESATSLTQHVLDLQLNKSLMHDIQGLTNTPALEHNYRIGKDGTLFEISSSSLPTAGTERRRRHTVGNVTTPAHATKKHYKIHHQQGKWKSKCEALMETCEVDELRLSSAPMDIVMSSANLQDLAAEARELAVNLPDNLASVPLLRSIDSATAVGDGDLDTHILESLEEHPSVSLQTSQNNSGGTSLGTEKILCLTKKSRVGMSSGSSHYSIKRAKLASLSGNKTPVKTSAHISVTDSMSASNTVKRKLCSCTQCPYKTCYIKDLQRHLRTHTGERPFQCSHCSKKFNRSDKLRVHIRWHTGDKPFKCPQCSYASVDSSSLKKHIRTHTDERPFKCQICPYASRNSSQLIVHLRTHTGDSPFECGVCHAKFKINSDLKRHMRVHTGEKPFSCEFCDYKCSIKGNLKSHYKINHSPDNQLACNRCSFSSSSQKLLREHMKKHAPGEVCPVCQYMCSSSSSLKNHLRVHSDVRPYRCDFCSYSAKQRGNVKSHMKKRHADKLRSSRRHSRNKSSSISMIRVLNLDVTKPQIREGGRISGDTSGRSVRPACKKLYSCHLCGASFVREDSLRCHVRQHKDEQKHGGHETSLHQPSVVRSASHEDNVYKVNQTIQASEGLYIQVETEGPEIQFCTQEVTSVSDEKPGVSQVAVELKNQQGRVVALRGLDQIADAASKMYQEQYQVNESEIRMEVRESDLLTDDSQIQVIQIPVDSSVGSAAEQRRVLPPRIKHPSIKNRISFAQSGAESLTDSGCQTYIKNIPVTGNNEQQINSKFNMVSSHPQNVPSSSYILCTGSPSSTPSKNLITYVSGTPSLPATTTTPYLSYIPSSPNCSGPSQSSDTTVTYVAPATSAPQQCVQANYTTQEITLMQQEVDGKTVFTPVSYTFIPSSFSQNVSHPPQNGSSVSLADNNSQTVVLPSSSSSSSSLGLKRLSDSSQPKYIRCDLPVTPVESVGQQATTSGMVTLSSSDHVAHSPNKTVAGSLKMIQLTSSADGIIRAKLADSMNNVQQELQDQLSSCQPIAVLEGRTEKQVQKQLYTKHLPHQQSNQVVLQQQHVIQQLHQQHMVVQSPQQQHMVVQSPQQQQIVIQQHQPQFVLPCQQIQPSQIPISFQVVHQEAVQQQQLQSSIPINIITPIGIQHQPLTQSTPQATQIQIVLPPGMFQNPVMQPSEKGSTAQPQTILQLQEPGSSTQPPVSPPAVQDTSLALMQGSRLLSLPADLIQTILTQLQNGMDVSISGSADPGSQILNELPIQLQELVIQMDPQQTVLIKKESGH